MREYTGSRTRAFLPVRLAELHSAVGTKAIARALRQAAGYKPAGRTGRRPVFHRKLAMAGAGSRKCTSSLTTCAQYLACIPSPSK